jgi:hypothetical protein
VRIENSESTERLISIFLRVCAATRGRRQSVGLDAALEALGMALLSARRPTDASAAMDRLLALRGADGQE